MLIEKLNDINFDEVYELMEMSFPKDERRTYSEQKNLLNNPMYRIYVFRACETQQIQAFIAVWELGEIAFVEHVAVNPMCRNNGIGAKVLNELVNNVGKMVCLEVEPPNDEMSSRRIEFYKRNNFFFNEYFYIQPPMSEGRKSIQLYIMTSERKITESEFNNIKNMLYKEVYCVDTEKSM